MKFLVLALCVCAASAATFTQKSYGSGGYKPFSSLKNPPVAPVVTAAKAVVKAAAPVVVPAAVVAAAPAVVPAVAAYEAASFTYQAAKQVNKAYSNDGEAAILRSESDVKPDGYSYGYETANGINAESSGTYKQIGDAGAVVSRGSYRYTAPDGTPVEVTFVADENGYQPQSASLPVGPETPPEIARSLIYIAEQTRNAVQKS